MKTLHNPTDNIIEVQIFGVRYVVDPHADISLPEDAANYWMKNLHHFMEAVAGKSADVVEAPAEVAEPVDEVVEDVAEEPVVEKVKRAVKRVTKK